jgi:hypothetical protein
MVYNTQNCWVFALCPSSSILNNTKEHNVSEIGSVSVLRRRVGGRKEIQFPKRCVFRTSHDEQSSKTQ